MMVNIRKSVDQKMIAYRGPCYDGIIWCPSDDGHFITIMGHHNGNRQYSPSYHGKHHGLPMSQHMKASCWATHYIDGYACKGGEELGKFTVHDMFGG